MDGRGARILNMLKKGISTNIPEKSSKTESTLTSFTEGKIAEQLTHSSQKPSTDDDLTSQKPSTDDGLTLFNNEAKVEEYNSTPSIQLPENVTEVVFDLCQNSLQDNDSSLIVDECFKEISLEPPMIPITDIAESIEDSLPFNCSNVDIEIGTYDIPVDIFYNGEDGMPYYEEDAGVINEEVVQDSAEGQEVVHILSQEVAEDGVEEQEEIGIVSEEVVEDGTEEQEGMGIVNQEVAEDGAEGQEEIGRPIVNQEVTEDGVEDQEFIVPDEENQEKEKKARKRKADPESWERNIRKKSRMSGKSYRTTKGVLIQEKKPVPLEECNCRFKCSTHISVNRQKALFEEYWEIANADKQKVFVSHLVQEKAVERHRKRNEGSNKIKNRSRAYYLPDENKEKHRVCLKFFCTVFQISFQIIDLALKRSSSSGVYVGSDGRIGRPAPNKTKPEVINRVKQHIDSFPRMESHYCRKHTKKLYLSPELNLAELYRLYVKYCREENIEPVTSQNYRTIFNSYDPPLATYVPKKDQCTKCNQYHRAEDKSQFEEEYQIHYRRKTEAMDMKKKDMSDKADDKVTITFDLQAVLCVPFAGDCQIYYKRKLSVYNLTIYDSHGNGFCYIWDECNGMKGSCEIGTALLTYIQNLPESVTHLVTYSDTCGGQNRNQFISAAMLFAVNTTHIETIDMKFMESGHSYLEADSMHATIERARKHKKIYTPREWSILIEMARKKPSPYKVNCFEFGDIKDLTNLGKEVMKNRSLNDLGDTVNWLKIKWLRFEKSEPCTIQYKYELQEEPSFLKLNVCSGGNNGTSINWNVIKLVPKYQSRIPISNAKKKDLLSLLKTGVIPNCYSTFVNELPASEKSKDVVPYAVEGEDDEDFTPLGKNKFKPLNPKSKMTTRRSAAVRRTPVENKRKKEATQKK